MNRTTFQTSYFNFSALALCTRDFYVLHRTGYRLPCGMRASHKHLYAGKSVGINYIFFIRNSVSKVRFEVQIQENMRNSLETFEAHNKIWILRNMLRLYFNPIQSGGMAQCAPLVVFWNIYRKKKWFWKHFFFNYFFYLVKIL